MLSHSDDIKCTRRSYDLIMESKAPPRAKVPVLTGELRGSGRIPYGIGRTGAVAMQLLLFNLSMPGANENHFAYRG